MVTTTNPNRNTERNQLFYPPSLPPGQELNREFSRTHKDECNKVKTVCISDIFFGQVQSGDRDPPYTRCIPRLNMVVSEESSRLEVCTCTGIL